MGDLICARVTRRGQDTGEDLCSLFSFYWRPHRERELMYIKMWERQNAHIVRLNERDVTDVGLLQKAFTMIEVDDSRAWARSDPIRSGLPTYP